MRRIPTRPAPTSATGQFPAAIVFDELVRRHGPVIDMTDVAAFASRHGVSERYVRDALGLHVELGLADQPRRGLWLASCASERGRSHLEMVRAHAAGRVLGPWIHVTGAWALQLRGDIHELPAPALRTCASPRPAKLRTEQTTRDVPWRPRPTTRRHVTTIIGAPIATITRPVGFLTRCDWLTSDPPRSAQSEGSRMEHAPAAHSIGAHVERSADALVTILEHPRLNGGADVALQAAATVIRSCGLQAVVDAAARTRFMSTRRRVALAIAHAHREDPMLEREVLRDGRLSEATLTSWLDEDFAQMLALEPARELVLVDPHRSAVGASIARYGLLDNRGAPLQVRRVALPVDVDLSDRPGPGHEWGRVQRSGDRRK